MRLELRIRAIWCTRGADGGVSYSNDVIATECQLGTPRVHRELPGVSRLNNRFGGSNMNQRQGTARSGLEERSRLIPVVRLPVIQETDIQCSLV